MAEHHDKYDTECFKNAEAMAALFEGDWREEVQYADEVIRAIVTRNDVCVVDLGAGTGYFTRRLARALPKGRVHALDSEQAMIDWIKEKVVPKDDLKNVTMKVVPVEDPLLDEVPFEMDVLLMAYTYSHLGPLDVRVAYMRDKVRPKIPKDALVVFVECDAMPDNEHMHGYGDHAQEQGNHAHDGHDHSHHEHHHGEDDHPDPISPEELKKELDIAGFVFLTDYGYNHKPNYMLAFKLKT